MFEHAGSNIADTLTGVSGDADAAFRDAPYTRREHFRVQRHAAVPMEPRGLLAEWDEAAQRITVSGICKVPFTNRRALAKMMKLPEASVRMIEYDVGGGFGARGEFYPEDFLMPFAARLLSRPVKWTEDRRENLIALNHAREIACDLEIACTRDGTLIALRGHAISRSWRLCAHQWRHLGAQYLPGHDRPVSVPACPHGRDDGAEQQDAVRHLSGARPLRVGFLPRAAVRHGGGRSRHRPRSNSAGAT